MGRKKDKYKLLSCICPDEKCQATLYFPSYDKSIECTGCGRRHERNLLNNVAEVTNPSVALHNVLKNILLNNIKPKKGSDNIKVLGLSNYVCKLLSPILSKNGMDKQTGKAKLLTDMGRGKIFDCGILGDHAFMIEEENLDVIGYGRDRSGSLHYLEDTLNVVKSVNGQQERLVPIHADGDGHCLVHAVSRALVGRELFWHALRLNLTEHFKKNIETYRQMFVEFIDVNEWDDIINECDPDFVPYDDEPLGLRNIHVFGLANVLKRPIILLDSISGMQSLGDYSGVFLPGLVPPEECRGKDGSLHKPLCIAWSSSGRNHYIPLVAVKGRELPRLPRYMIQKTWGLPDTYIDKYIQFDSEGMCTICGDKCLQDKYIERLVTAMEEVFTDMFGVNPKLVADVHQCIYKSSGFVGVKPETVVKATEKSIKENRLYRCLTCDALTEYQLSSEWFVRGGSLYKLAVQSHGALSSDKQYSFPMQGAVCTYDGANDCLIPDMKKSRLNRCTFCSGDHVRVVNGDCTVSYINGDRTMTRSTNSKCTCGYKHYWDGKEYDNLPEMFPVSLDWGGKSFTEKVVWFQYETDLLLNSNVYEVAQQLVQKHFPGEFGSERLVQRVVDTILRQTAKPVTEEEPVAMDTKPAWSPESPSKIIISGQQTKSIHKEELNKSKAERDVRKKIEENAPKLQRRKSAESESAAQSSAHKISPKNSPRRSASDNAVSSISNQPPAPEPIPSNEKRVKLATSDGKQAMLKLPNDLTYNDLQQLIMDAVKVPPDQQKIRLGFPPKELKPPPEELKDQPLSISSGDKIMLEIIPVTPIDTRPPRPSTSSDVSPGLSPVKMPPSVWSNFEEGSHSQSAEKLLDSLKDVRSSGDSIDTSIASLALMATITGKDLWTYVQAMPHLFSVGGLFYQQVDRDLSLADGKHCTLPALPGKVFRYNSHADRLELCCEPHGHFPVEPDIERKAIEISKKRDFLAQAEPKFGSSGAIGHKCNKSQVAFTGQGHSLRTSPVERMPTDLIEEHSRPAARRAWTLSDPNRHQDSIAEEDSETEKTPDRDIDSNESAPLYQRLGPGVSVISPVAQAASLQSDIIRSLVDTINSSMDDQVTVDALETITEDSEDNTDGRIDEDSTSNDDVLVLDLGNEASADANNISCSEQNISDQLTLMSDDVSEIGMNKQTDSSVMTNNRSEVTSGDNVLSSELPTDAVSNACVSSFVGMEANEQSKCQKDQNIVPMETVNELKQSDISPDDISEVSMDIA